MKTQQLIYTGAALVLLAALSLRANVTNITSGGPEYPNFNSAFPTANNGDTLRGRAATWNEIAMVPVNKHLTLDGGYNAAYTTKIGMSVLTNESSSPVLQIMPGSKAYLQSLVIKGGDGTGPGAGGVWALLSTAIVVNCVVSNCASQYGAGLNSAGLIIASNTVVTECVASKQGGGVYVRSGAAFHAYQNTRIRFNTAANEGGGIYAQPGLVELSACEVVNNVASTADGGGLYAQSGVVVRVTATSIAGNSATFGNGGGLYAENADVELLNSFVVANVAANFGGGIRQQYGTLVVSNTAINGNYAQMGGGIYNNDTVVRLYDSQVGTLTSPNLAQWFAGGISINNSGDADVRMRNVLIEGNTGDFTTVGGAQIFSQQPVWFSNVIVRFNRAQSLAGLAINAQGGLQAYHLQVVSNGAFATGGGTVSAQSNLLLYAPVIVGNTSYFGTAGLDVSLFGATGSVIRALVQHNRSGENVGGITFSGSGGELLYLDDPVIADNTGDADGDHNGWTGGLRVNSLKARLRALTQPVQIVRNHGGSVGGLSVEGGTLLCEAPSAANHILIAQNSAVLTSGVGGVFLEAGWYGLTAQFVGAVHVISNSGYHGGIVVTNVNYYWNSNQTLFVTLPTNGLGARIAYNHSEGPGGGLYVYGEGTEAHLHSARLEHNFVGYSMGGGAAVLDKGQARFVNTYIGGNFCSNLAGGVAVLGSGARAYFDADFASAPPSHLPPTRLVNNVANISAGGVFAGNLAELYVYNTLIASNRATFGNAGGMSVQSAVAEVRNAVITRNSATGPGDGIAVFSSPQFSLVNSTVAHNETNGLYVFNTPMSFIQNTIVWGHGGLGYEFNEVMYTSTLQHCTVQGGYPGTLVLTNDPLFWNTANLDYQLSPGSLCIDTGQVSLVSTDCIGTTRPQLAAYDIGAYEFIPEPAGVVLLAAGALLLARKRS